MVHRAADPMSRRTTIALLLTVPAGSTNVNEAVGDD